MGALSSSGARKLAGFLGEVELVAIDAAQVIAVRIARLRTLVRSDRDYAPVLGGFEAIDLGRRILENRTTSAAARRSAEELIWNGNTQLLAHEQHGLVQPNFDRLSCVFARLLSIGAATSFEVHGLRREVAYFTSFSPYSVTRAIPRGLRAQPWPRITRYDDRWHWLVTSVVPRFRRLDADPYLIDASVGRILADARAFASTPCLLPLLPPTDVAIPGARPHPPSDRPSAARGGSLARTVPTLQTDALGAAVVTKVERTSAPLGTSPPAR